MCYARAQLAVELGDINIDRFRAVRSFFVFSRLLYRVYRHI